MVGSTFSCRNLKYVYQHGYSLHRVGRAALDAQKVVHEYARLQEIVTSKYSEYVTLRRQLPTLDVSLYDRPLSLVEDSVETVDLTPACFVDGDMP